MNLPKGILLVDKMKGSTSFQIVSLLRQRTSVQKIGHAGTLDPMATGLMILLIGKEWTQKSDRFLSLDKTYVSTITCGMATDTFDADGEVVSHSTRIPSLEEIESALLLFQGQVSQIPPMYSAKKVQGKKLYELARKGITIERQPVSISLTTTLIRYAYPEIELRISCSKGTYIRSIANDLGAHLNIACHLSSLKRERIGPYSIENAISQRAIQDGADFTSYLVEHI